MNKDDKNRQFVLLIIDKLFFLPTYPPIPKSVGQVWAN
jgi:transposase